MATTDVWFLGGPAPAEADLVLFCVPHAGGGGVGYKPWSAMLPASVHVQPVQLPGRETRAAEAPDFDPADLARALAARAGGLPYAIYGHSMGGVLAQEVVRELMRLGEPLPERLVVGASHPPHVESAWIGRWRSLRDEELLEEIIALGGTPEVVRRHPRLRDRLVRVLRADVGWLSGYRLPPAEEMPRELPVPIAAIAGARDPIAPPEAMAAWRELTSGGFALTVIDAGHFFHLDAPAEIAGLLPAGPAAARTPAGP